MLFGSVVLVSLPRSSKIDVVVSPSASVLLMTCEAVLNALVREVVSNCSCRSVHSNSRLRASNLQFCPRPLASRKEMRFELASYPIEVKFPIASSLKRVLPAPSV